MNIQQKELPEMLRKRVNRLLDRVRESLVECIELDVEVDVEGIVQEMETWTHEFVDQDQSDNMALIRSFMKMPNAVRNEWVCREFSGERKYLEIYVDSINDSALCKKVKEVNTWRDPNDSEPEEPTRRYNTRSI